MVDKGIVVRSGLSAGSQIHAFWYRSACIVFDRTGNREDERSRGIPSCPKHEGLRPQTFKCCYGDSKQKSLRRWPPSHVHEKSEGERELPPYSDFLRTHVRSEQCTVSM